MNGSRCSAADCPVGGVLSVEGLPPLPKGLSGILNSSGGSWRDIEKVHSKRARIQADISRGGGDAPRPHSKPGGLDAALALLRKEMVSCSASILPISAISVTFIMMRNKFQLTQGPLHSFSKALNPLISGKSLLSCQDVSKDLFPPSKMNFHTKPPQVSSYILCLCAPGRSASARHVSALPAVVSA